MSIVTDSSTGREAHFTCFTHEFDTTNLDDWNDHMLGTPHIEQGQTACKDCGEIVYFDAIPFHPHTQQGKDYQVRCDDCFPKFQALHDSIKGKLRKAESDDPESILKVQAKTIVPEGGNTNDQ